MGGSTDAFALYLSLFQVSRPTDPLKPSTSLSFHKEAESKFEFGTSNLKPDEKKPAQEGLMSYEEVKAGLEEKQEEEMETEEVQANPMARGGRRLGGAGAVEGEGEEEKGKQQEGRNEGERDAEKPSSMRELAVRAAEKRAQIAAAAAASG